MLRVLAISSVVLLWLCNLGATATDGDEKYREEIESWRQKRVADLKAQTAGSRSPGFTGCGRARPGSAATRATTSCCRTGFPAPSAR